MEEQNRASPEEKAMLHAPPGRFSGFGPKNKEPREQPISEPDQPKPGIDSVRRRELHIATLSKAAAQFKNVRIFVYDGLSILLMRQRSISGFHKRQLEYFSRVPRKTDSQKIREKQCDSLR
jgi:hypothetical protein